MGLINYFRKNNFVKHLFFVFLVTFVLFWLLTVALKYYTRYDKLIDVPDFTGLNVKNIDTLADNHKLKYIIIDSVFDYKKPKGTVVSQDPPAKSKVKEDRKIYLTVISNSTEQVNVPNLIDLSLRQAISVLETYGLKLGKLEYVASEFKNAVLNQKYKGRNISPETLINSGSTIDLVLGDGYKEGHILIPFLIGKSRNEAIKRINSLSLNLGKETFIDCKDTSEAKVFQQKPDFTDRTSLKMGNQVDLVYKSFKKFNFDNYVKKIIKDTIK